MSPPDARRRTRRVAFTVPVVAGLLGVLAAGAIWAREVSQARERDLQAASEVALALAQASSSSIDGLRGAGAMVAEDGVVSAAELQAFAQEIGERAVLRAVAHAVTVADSERAAFEAELGAPISDLGPDGTLVPASRRATYAPVVAVETDDPTVRPSIGFDLLGDPLRSPALLAVAAGGVPSLSPPLSFVGTTRTGYLSAAALRAPGGEVVGYITGSFAIDDALAAARERIDPGTEVAMFDHGERIAGDLDSGARASIVIGGRELEVLVDEPTPATWWPAVVVALGALLASVALALALASLRRSERSASMLAARVSADRAKALHLADLGRQLTTVTTREEVVDLLTETVPEITTADQTDLAFVDGSLLRSPGEQQLVPLDTHWPTTEAVRAAHVVTVADVDAYQQPHPDLLADARARRICSAAAIPLLDTTGAAFGVIGLAWHDHHLFSDAEEVRLATLGALVAGTVQRVDATAAAVRHADGLARLAEELAVASTFDQVAAAATRHVPAVSDAAAVRLAVAGDRADGGERHAIADMSGDVVGELVVEWPTAVVPDGSQRERLQAAVGLIDNTVRRVDFQRSTSEALLSLRQRLLRPLPSPEGLDLAARYRPTSRPLGMGGDWYDVVERRDGRVGIVIGDVVGHGISAIATMIHVSTILSGLVRSDVAVDEIIGRAASMLDVEGMIGTAQVVVIDPRRDELAMISAGHPPPLLRLPDGQVQRLAEATHAPLGVGDGSGRVVHVPFPPGASLLSYTDGLVERRDEPIDVGISRLADVFATTNGSVWGAVSDVLEAMAVSGVERSGDDVAVVIAHHRLATRAG